MSKLNNSNISNTINNTTNNSNRGSKASSISKIINKNYIRPVVSTSLVDSIISKVKDNEKNNLIVYLMIAIPLLLFLIYIVYKYNFSSRSTNVISNLDYDTIVELEPLKQCYEIDPTQQYKLCDYYISSSYMTPCVGNLHYDYVSLDMIIEVLKSGARYIQIPICESDITVNAIPVVGTAVYGQRLVTSLNTLDIKSVLNTILTTAFTINNKKINYPLIIHFVLNTSNKFTLNILAQYLAEILGNVLVDASKYQTSNNNIPIHFEKLCNLLGKIIIYSTPEYIGTDLEPFVIPTSQLYQIYHYSELGPINMPNDTIYTNYYNQKLSGTQQRDSNNYFKKKYHSINYVLENINTIGETILNDSNLTNNLTSFNKLGMSIIKPSYPEDVVSKNYDSSESIFYGCQLTTMNFQVNDINMQNYILIFKESSFRLKPASLRFSEAEEPIVDYGKIYKSLTKADTNILNDFFYKYGNILIAIESYSLLKTYLTQTSTSLKFNVGTSITKDSNGKKIYDIGLNQLFIPRLSKISKLNNISMYLESASIPGFFITLTTNSFDLENLATSNQNLLNQAMYIEKPKMIDNNYIGDMISIRSTNDTTPLYLAVENKVVKAYIDNTLAEAKSNMTYIIHKINFRHVINIITSVGGIVFTTGDGVVGVKPNNIVDGTSYYVNPHNNTNGNNFNIFNDQFTLQNKTKNTFINYDLTTKLLYDKLISPDTSSIFNLVLQNGYYEILNVNDKNLTVNNRGILTFDDESLVNPTGNLFTIKITYELTSS